MQRGPDAAGNRIGIVIGVDQHTARRIVRGNLPIGLAQALMEGELLALEPVRCAAAAPCRRTCQTDLDRQIEENRVTIRDLRAATKTAATQKYLDQELKLRDQLQEQRRRLLPAQQKIKQLRIRRSDKVAALDKEDRQLTALDSQKATLSQEIAQIDQQLYDLEADVPQTNSLAETLAAFF